MRRVMLVMLGVVGCGPTTQAPTTPSNVRVVEARGTAGAALTAESISTPSPVARLGTSQSGQLALALDDGRFFERTADGLEPRSLYAEGDDPLSPGRVTSISPRAAGGAWVAAEAGLFVLDHDFVSHAPITAGMGALGGVSEATSGQLAGLWLSASNGVYRRQSEATQRYQLQGYENRAALAVVDPAGAGALVAFDGALFALTPGTDAPSSDEGVDTGGAVRGFAAMPGALFAATANGLLRWQANTTPAWSRFSLDEGGVDAVAVDAVSGSAWASAGTVLFRIDRDEVTRFELAAPRTQLAVDQVGDLYALDAAGLQRFAVGTPGAAVSFETSVAPWLQQHCARCHADFQTREVFAPKAASALQRVKAGDMPRCEGALICPTEQRLPASEYEVLERWIRGGSQP